MPGHAYMGVGTAPGREKAEQAAMAGSGQPAARDQHQRAPWAFLTNAHRLSGAGAGRGGNGRNIVMEAANPDANIISAPV